MSRGNHRAIYTDSGLKLVEKFILNFWKDHILIQQLPIDSKTKLQEYSLKKFKELPKYIFSKKTGPQHKPIFKTEVQIPSSKITGFDPQKKCSTKRSIKIIKIIKNMIWEDECYLLSKRKFRENANIINIFTKERGKVDGIVYGGNSRKIRNYLQISNKLFVSHSSKNENKIGYFKTELIKPISPLFFNDKERTSALISICSILNILLPEAQQNKNLYFI